MNCTSCGKEWVDHMGIEGTCGELQKARQRIEELERIYDEQHEELTAGLVHQAGIISRLYHACPRNLQCEDFHHSKADRHDIGDVCPPLKRYQDALAMICLQNREK